MAATSKETVWLSRRNVHVVHSLGYVFSKVGKYFHVLCVDDIKVDVLKVFLAVNFIRRVA